MMRLWYSNLTCRLALASALSVLTVSAIAGRSIKAQSEQRSGQSPSPQQQDRQVPLTFRVTTREVIVDVIAVDGHGRPVVDLKPADLQVFDQIPELTQQRKRHHVSSPQSSPDQIASFTIVNPATKQAPPAESLEAGFRLGTSCLDRATLHYQLAYHPGPQGFAPGYHDVLITTTRRGAHLFYSHRYYVGATAPDPKNLPDKLSAPRLAQLADQLRQAACYRSTVPSSIALRASLIDTGRTDQLRYSVAVDADSLAFISLSDNGRGVQLDYAVCNFDVDGQPIDYLHGSLDQVLTPVEYTRALAHGFPHLIDFPTPPHLGLSRFVVRDLVTGNIGSVDTVYPVASRPPPDPAAVAQARETDRLQAIGNYGHYAPPQGPIGSFGSIVPAPDSFCGDIYEIPGDTSRLPDFRELDPIASIYTDSLAVPNQIFSGTPGIPGVTPRVAWFGIDYYGTFWIRNPGDYEFMMTSDDGAILQIDDQHVIGIDGAHMALTRTGHVALDAGVHNIHVPYFQGPPDAVALQLWVKPPGAAWQIFDLRDFAPNLPAANPNAVQQASATVGPLPPQETSPSVPPPQPAASPSPAPPASQPPPPPQETSSDTPGSREIAPQALKYLDDAFRILQQHAIYPSRVDWKSLRKEAIAKAAGAHLPSDTWPAIVDACLQLRKQQQCSSFDPPDGASPAALAGALEAMQADTSASGHTSSGGQSPFADRQADVQILTIADGKRFAYLVIPTCTSRDLALCAATLRLCLLKANDANPDGWIVDLRGDGSGELWPVLAGLGPLIGNGTIAYAETEGGGQPWVYWDNAITRSVYEPRGQISLALHDIPIWSMGGGGQSPHRPDRPVAVLIDHDTAGSGEDIAIAFAGRKDEHSFGATTRGDTNPDIPYVLPDGAALHMQSELVADRRGHLYPHGVQPDVRVEEPPAVNIVSDPVIHAAEDWLKSIRQQGQSKRAAKQ
jgi:hypothetical protein